MPNRDEKIFPALPQRRARAREEGKIARSRDLTGAISFLAAAAILSGAAAFCGEAVVESFRSALRVTASGDLGAGIGRALGWPLIGALVLGALLAAAAVLGATVQEGLVFATQRLAPDLARLNPVQYFQRVFSSTGLLELGKAAFKVTLIVLVAWQAARATATAAVGMHSIGQLLPVLAVGVRRLLLWSVTLALAAAIADYLHKRYEHEADLRMTRQEFLDELKQEQGNPHVRRAMRRLQRKSFRRIRGINQAATASVVLTNPTHYAVAVRYRRGFDRAPLIVAKGAGETAQRVIAIARLAAIPIVENKPLARALYKVVEVGDHIPRQFYRAVAEVLAAIMRAQARRNLKLPVSA